MKGFIVVITTIIIILTAFLQLVSAESPVVASETPRIQSYLVQKLQHPVELKSVSLIWHGIIPVIDIQQFTIYSQDHKQKLFSVGEVSARIKIIQSLISGRVQLSYLYINYLNLLFAKEKNLDNNQMAWQVVNLEFFNTLFNESLQENFSDKFTLECEHLGLGFQHVFPNYLPVTYLKTTVLLNKNNDHIDVHLKNINLKNTDVHVSGEVEYVNHNVGFDLAYYLNSTVPYKLNNYLPHTIMDSDLIDWLVSSVIKFDKIVGTARLQNKQFTAQFQVNDLNLQYQPGWPMAKKLDAILAFTNTGLNATILSGTLEGVNLHQVDVSIPNFSHSILNISGSASSQSKLMQNYVLQSPLRLSFGQYFQDVDWLGNSHLQINITIPLNSGDQSKTKVKGLLTFSDNTLKLYNKFILNKAKAEIIFDENGIKGDKFSALYLDEPVNVDIFGEYYLINYKQYRVRLSNGNNRRLRLTFSQPDIRGVLDYQNKKIVGNFQYIILKSTPNKFIKKKSNNINPDIIPESDITVNDFRYDLKKFGQVIFKTTPFSGGLKLQYLRANIGNSVINLTGFWNRNISSVQGSIVSHNLAELLNSWNISSSIKSNSAKMGLQLNWQDSLYSPDVQSMSGKMQINIGSGELLNVGSQAKTDFGRLLTLLSIQSLAKRLRLDFSDLNMSSKGLSFDNISGDFIINSGIAKTNNLSLEGPVANINIRGAMNLINQSYNLNVEVTPHLTSSIPAIAAIAGGPVAGAAAWAAGKLFNPILNKITSDNYTVTGPWKNPVIKQM